ncbi:MAG: hypothetical protein LBP54_04995 [Campylobacteraceae bacterium]|jgi:hypothetical protein|nr:hypothetical protein [Campylobacteraceae bacterium]
MAKTVCKIFFTLSVIFLFAGCGGSGGIGGSSKGDNGGGNGGGSGSGGGGTSSLLVPDCNGSFCAAVGNAYTGSGIGVWYYKNGNTNSATLNVNLSNVANRDITIVFTNEGAGSAVLPNIPINTTLTNRIEPNMQNIGEYVDTFNHIPPAIREFNANPFLQKIELNRAVQAPNAKTWQVNDEGVWKIHDNISVYENRTAKVIKQITISGGRVVNIWVENGEYVSGKITEPMLNDITQKLNDVLSRAVGLIGEPWGVHQYSNLIPANEPLNIVFVNFDRNNQAFGLMGYFYGLNNYLKARYPTSNEALAVFIDTETLYKHSNGTLYIISTIAHEFTHAIHFYQRDVLMDDGFDTFLNEMSAIMMEDIAAEKIDSVFNDVKGRYIDWHKGPLYRYNFSEWGDYGGDSSYDIAGSFGAFLLRQYGTDFYRTLFQTSSNSSITGSDQDEKARKQSLDILDRAIKQYDSGGLSRALRHWGASIAMLPYDASPKGFGYPRRYESGSGISFAEFNGADYKQYRKLPTSSSQTIYPYGHFPFLRKTTENTFTESFSVPPKTTVSVVVQ